MKIRCSRMKEPIADSETSYHPLYLEGIEHFNHCDFFESHESWEDLWTDYRGPSRKFYQGLIQAAAAFYHVLNNNPKGVIRLAEEAQNKLRGFAPVYKHTIDISELLAALKGFAAQSREILGSTLTGFDFDRLPKIKVLVRE